MPHAKKTTEVKTTGTVKLGTLLSTIAKKKKVKYYTQDGKLITSSAIFKKYNSVRVKNTGVKYIDLATTKHKS